MRRKFVSNFVIIGMLVSLPFLIVAHYLKSKRISEGVMVKTCANTDWNYVDAILGSTFTSPSETMVDSYFMVIQGKREFSNIMIGGIPKEINVTVVDTMRINSELVKIYLSPYEQSKSQYLGEYYWIWTGYLCNVK